LRRIRPPGGGRRVHPRPPPLPRRGRVTAPSAEWKARRAARAALDKRAGDLVVLDVQRVSSVTDYFLICSGKSTTHLETITEAIRPELRRHALTLLPAE